MTVYRFVVSLEIVKHFQCVEDADASMLALALHQRTNQSVQVWKEDELVDAIPGACAESAPQLSHNTTSANSLYDI